MAEGLLHDDPTKEVKEIREVKAAPKALQPLELLRLSRTGQKIRCWRSPIWSTAIRNCGITQH